MIPFVVRVYGHCDRYLPLALMALTLIVMATTTGGPEGDPIPFRWR